VGDSCTVLPPPDGSSTAPNPCPGTSLACKGGRCVLPDAHPGDGCDASTECASVDFDLSCLDTIDAGTSPDGGPLPVPKACKLSPRSPALGDPCQNSCDYRAFCLTQTCAGTTTGTCVPKRKAGESCGPLDGGTTAECVPELECQNDGGARSCGPLRPYTCGAK
jgi:hypothetical protein